VIVRLEALSFVSQGRTILDGLTISIPDNSLTCLVGPNGAGKTTLLRILSGELRSTSGRLLIGDADASRLSQREIARRLAIIPQNVQPPPHLTVLELVELGRFRPDGPFWRRPSEHDLVAVNSSLTRCRAGSFSERPVEELSGGEQQRVWLAFGLAQQKRFLLLDETLDGLDAFAKRSFFELLKVAASEGTGIVLTTHDLDLVADYADKVIVLSRGRVAYEGPPNMDLERCLSPAGEGS
jgi:iron complex transport system ATP-binding protein